MAFPKLTIATDSYWPQKGGVEMASLTLASNLKDTFNIQIVTHSGISSRSLFKCFSVENKIPHIDPNGIAINLIKPRLFHRLLLLPLLIWNIPWLKKSFIYDLLYFFYFLAFRTKLLNLIGSSDIVHCFSTGYLARCISEICRKKNIKLINSPFIHFGKWGDSPGQISAYNASDAIVCPTESFKANFLSIVGTSRKSIALVIPPLIPIPHTSIHVTSNPYNKFILFVGRREMHKGLKLLLSAYQGLEPYGKLVIAGPGAKIDSISTEITDLGEIDDSTKQKLLCGCSLLCVPSSDETFGIIYVEAMSYGKPVVALDISPVNEIILNGNTGILVSKDNINDLHLALEKLLTDDKLRESMGHSAKNHFNMHFSKNHILKQYLNVYKKNL